jgi:predicted RND superfamily exporter protein
LIGDHHESIQALDNFIAQYGGGLPIQIVWECRPDLPCEHALDTVSIEMALALTRSIAPEPGVRRVSSPATSPLLVSTADGFAVRRLVEHGVVVPDLQSLAPRALEDPLWRNTLVSSDGSVGVVVVQPTDTRSSTETHVVNAIDRALEAHRSAGFHFFLVGDPVETHMAGEDLAASMARLVPLTVVIISLVLLVLFKSSRVALAALLTVTVALLWTFGLIGWLGWPRDATLEVLAPLILVVGVCDAIHLLSRYSTLAAQATQSTNEPTALLYAVSEVSAPCVMTTLTTAVAFLSFATSALDTFVRFGVLAAVGVGFCLFLTFTLLPILVRTVSPTEIGRTSLPWARALESVVDSANRRAGSILVISSLLAGASAFGWIAHLRVDTDWYESFGEDSRVVRSLRFVDERLRSSETLEVDIRFPETSDVASNLDILRSFSVFLSQSTGLGESRSVVNTVEQVNRLLHDDDSDYEQIGASPSENAEILELIAFEDPGALEPWITFDRTSARISVDARTGDASAKLGCALYRRVRDQH